MRNGNKTGAPDQLTGATWAAEAIAEMRSTPAPAIEDTAGGHFACSIDLEAWAGEPYRLMIASNAGGNDGWYMWTEHDNGEDLDFGTDGATLEDVIKTAINVCRQFRNGR